MFRKYLARLLAFVLVLNVLLCAPLRVGAEEGSGGTETFDADPVSVEPSTEGETNVVVTETVPETTVDADPDKPNSGVAVGDQTVSVEIPLDEATTEDVEGENPTVNEAGDAIQYDTTSEENATVHVEESYDLTVEITDADVDASGKLTDIEYDVSLDQKTTTQDTSNTPSETISNNVDQAWNAAASEAGSAQPEIKVNLSANGMNSEEITRVEHKYTDESGTEQTEYYYNAKQVEEGSNKKTFTVSLIETVKSATEKVTNTVVSLWTNFLGKFHITTDAFEGAEKTDGTKDTYSDLAEAVSNAENGSTVEMLRDYATSSTAAITNSNDVTVDLNDKQYTYNRPENSTNQYEAIRLEGDNQKITIQDGTIESTDDVLYLGGSGNQVILDNSDVASKATNSYSIYNYGTDNSVTIQNGSTVSSSGIYAFIDSGEKNTVNILNKSTVTSEGRGILMSGNSGTLTMDDSTLTSTGTGEYGIWSTGEKNTLNIRNNSIVSGAWSVVLSGRSKSNTLTVDNSQINSGVHGVASFGNGHSLNVLNGSDIKTGGFGLYIGGNSQILKVDNSQVSSGIVGIGANGKENSITIHNSTISSDISGVEIDSDRNSLIVTESNINATDTGIGDFGTSNTIKVEKSNVTTTGDESLGIYHNGSTGGADIQVIGTYVSATGKDSWGIYVSGSKFNDDGTPKLLNNLTLTDSTVEGSATGVEVKYTNVTINNSKLVGFGAPPDYVTNNNGTTTSGAALAVTDNRKYDENDPDKLLSKDSTAGTITINSGYFYGHKDIDSIFLAAKLQANDPQATIQLNGGRFVQTTGLYKLTDDTHAVISLNDGSEYPYEVVATGTTPTRSGYTFQGFKDENGKAITLEQAIEKKAIAYAQWEKIVEQPPVEDTPAEVPAETVPAETAPANNAAKQELIIVEADSKGNNVDIAIQDTTAVVTVSNPDGDAAAVSEVTIPSVAELKKQGVETVSVQVEENVTLELNLADAGNTLADSVKVTRDADILVISSGEQSEIVIHMTELKAAASEPVRIQLSNRVLTIHLGGDTVYQLELADDLAPGMTLTVKLEDGILKLYDKDGNLVREVKL